MADRTAIQRVLDRFDNSPSKVAAALGGNVKRQHVEYWVKVGRVPAEHCPDLEALADVPCEELCPGVNWARIRGTAKPSQVGAGA